MGSLEGAGGGMSQPTSWIPEVMIGNNGAYQGTYIKNQAGEYVASTWWTGTNRSVEADKQLGNLVGMAPEMLEALERALAELRRLDDDGSAFERMQIQDVIAKARGEK